MKTKNYYLISCKKIIDKIVGETYYLISFIEEDVPAKIATVENFEHFDINQQYQERIDELEKQLQFKSESLQATVEELETSNEELQSSNEELIASNEELQSTKEELQSVNEELYSVNSEHIRKIEELTELNADMDNLLKNTKIGNLFLDNDLNIRKINKVASQLTNILDSDIGRPIYHLSLNNLYPDFLKNINEVIQTLTTISKEIKDNNNNWYLMEIIPYRTAENAINGIIITFVNITGLKKSEIHVTNLENRLDIALNMGQLSWWEWDYQTNTVEAGQGKYKMLGYSTNEIEDGYEGWTKLLHPDDFEHTIQAMKDHLEGKAKYYFTEYRIKHKHGHYIWYRDKGGIVSKTLNGKPHKIAGIVQNITDEKLTVEKLDKSLINAKNDEKKANLKLDTLLNNIKQGVLFINEKSKIIEINSEASNYLGINKSEIKPEGISWKNKIFNENNTEIKNNQMPFKKALKSGNIQCNNFVLTNLKTQQPVSIQSFSIPYKNRETSGVIMLINKLE